MAPQLNSDTMDVKIANKAHNKVISKRAAIAKKLLDIVVSLLLLPVAFALCTIFGLLFLLLMRENPVFAQTRVGRYNRTFTLIKMRTMRSSTANKPTHEISRSDVSALGRFMRAIKVDELPQLINVLRGEMSLVGPRPCLPTQTDLINARLSLGVYQIKPGITGYAQVRGIDMSEPEQLALLDHTYLQQRSMMSDLALLSQTFLGRGIGDKTS